jgi:flagellar protein FliT
MVAAAQEKDWDRLVSLEQDCGTRFQTLLSTDDSRPRDAEYQRRKSELIRRLLADDAQIRQIVEPWLTQLTALIGNTHQQRRLAGAYQPDA